MKRISAGVSQIGGKFRLVKTILKLIPYHEFYLEPFLGAAWVLLNKPRCRYECGNDLNSELINYFLVIREYPKEFDALKQGVFGLVSQEICNRIVRGELVPRNNIERAYFFYYLNKLTFGGGVWMVRKKPPYKGIQPHAASKNEIKNIKENYDIKVEKFSYAGMGNSTLMDGFRKRNIKKAKEEYEWKTKGYRSITLPSINSKYRGVVLPTVCKDKSVNEAKASYGGLIDVGNSGGSAYGKMPRKRDIHIYQKSYKQAQNKGINPKTTRPYTNNDCGLLSPIQPTAIKRLRYINLTTYPFQKVYNMFYQAFHVRKGLGPECFVYFDPPYPGTEKLYRSGFDLEDHQDLIKIIKESPFHVMLSIGSKCDLYLEELKDFNIIPVKVKYSTDANSQKESQEYIIMNYDINELPLMKFDSSQKTILENFL